MDGAGVSYDGSGTGQASTGGWYEDYTKPQSLNGWAYSDGNPTNLTDPSGHGPIHFQVVVYYAVKYRLEASYVIVSTIPATPPLWPGQLRGKRVDLATPFTTHEVWEVEPYSPSGNYRSGHGPGQAQDYVDLLNRGVANPANLWFLGGILPDERFPAFGGAIEVHAWWSQPGLIVYEENVNNRVRDVLVDVCTAAFLAKLLQKLGENLPNPGLQMPPVWQPIMAPE